MSDWSDSSPLWRKSQHGEHHDAAASARLFSITTSILLFSHQLRLADPRHAPSLLLEARPATAIHGREFVIEPRPSLHSEVVVGHQEVMCSCQWSKVSVQEAFGPPSADRSLEEGLLGRGLLGGCRYRMTDLYQHEQELGVAVRRGAGVWIKIQNGEVTVMGFPRLDQASIGILCSKGHDLAHRIVYREVLVEAPCLSRGEAGHSCCTPTPHLEDWTLENAHVDLRETGGLRSKLQVKLKRKLDGIHPAP